MNKEMTIEEAKIILYSVIKLNSLKEIHQIEFFKIQEAIKTALKDRENSISKDKIEELKKYYEENEEILSSTYDKYSDGVVINEILKVLQELLEGE